MTKKRSYGPYVSVVDEFSVSSGGQTATLRKLKTKKGERLEIESPSGDETLRVDALGLESLSWQETEIFDRFLPDGHEMDLLDEESDDVTSDTGFDVANEYAQVHVRRLQSPERSTLQIRAPKKREQIQIDVDALGGLARQDHMLFTEFLEQPHGPEDHH